MKGALVCFVRAGEAFHRPAEILSEDFSERATLPGGELRLYCHLAVADPLWMRPYHPHRFEVDRPHDGLNRPETWHLPEECVHAGDDKKCAFHTAYDCPLVGSAEAETCAYHVRRKA